MMNMFFVEKIKEWKKIRNLIVFSFIRSVQCTHNSFGKNIFIFENWKFATIPGSCFSIIKLQMNII